MSIIGTLSLAASNIIQEDDFGTYSNRNNLEADSLSRGLKFYLPEIVRASGSELDFQNVI